MMMYKWFLIVVFPYCHINMTAYPLFVAQDYDEINRRYQTVCIGIHIHKQHLHLPYSGGGQ